MKFQCWIFLLALSAWAQPPSSLPANWSIGVGAEINSYVKPVKLTPTVSLMGCWTEVCEISTWEMQPTTATLRQEFAYLLKHSAAGDSMLMILAGGGLSNIQAGNGFLPNTINLGNIGGGIAAVGDLGAFFKALAGKGIKIEISLRENAVTSLGVKPQYQAQFYYRFK